MTYKISTDKIINDCYKKVDTYMRLHYRKRLDQLEITDVPGYWDDKDPCRDVTYSYLDRGRDRWGRFESQYKSWKLLWSSQKNLEREQKRKEKHKEKRKEKRDELRKIADNLVRGKLPRLCSGRK